MRWIVTFCILVLLGLMLWSAGDLVHEVYLKWPTATDQQKSVAFFAGIFFVGYGGPALITLIRLLVKGPGKES